MRRDAPWRVSTEIMTQQTSLFQAILSLKGASEDMVKNIGKGDRCGAVDNRSQTYNSVTD
jgi:hypothetical protein